MQKNYFLLVFLLFVFYGFSQNPVNAYANVSAISGTSLTVSNVNETFHSFENGDYIIIMQMQDNAIGTNTTNASSFGNAGPILSTGLFEVVRILTHTETSSVPTSITLATSLVNTYNINANASVQVITFRQLGTNFTSTASIGTTAWNGTVGGVTALWVPGTFTLNHSITADGAGFRGGSKNTPNGYSACNSTTYTTARAQLFAGKGEGIYKSTNSNFTGARGKILNGGGGGNDVNAGGGGGGNYLSGGDGGSGWVPAGTGCSPTAGGVGGISLSGSITASRIFMGGGGGGGHENDGVGTVGGNGGGIILIRTSTLVTNSCSGATISANGIAAGLALNDGAGGGGAAGSIVMQINSYSVSGSCALSVNANGGGGGNSNTGSSDAHGGGGGGGQGVVIYSTPQPTTNITTNTIPGAGGMSCGSCSASQNGSTGSGTSNTGIVPNSSGPLPVELVSFSAVLNEQNDVLVKWQTAIEKNSDRFIVQRMNATGLIIDAGELKSKGSYNAYELTDFTAEDGINYYRLNQIDEDGTSHLRNWVSIVVSKRPGSFTLYPNPVSKAERLIIECSNYYNQQIIIKLFDVTGRLKESRTVMPADNDSYYPFETSTWQPGVYFVMLNINGIRKAQKIILSQ